MKDTTKNWLNIALKDFKLAEASLNVNEPLGVIFHLHASVEKILKGMYEELKGNPPKIHNLKRLAIECCNLSLKEKEDKLLELLDKAFIDSRYPADILIFEEKYDIDKCRSILNETKGTIKWQKSLLKNNSIN